MATFRDDRYGPKGHVIWLLALGPPLFGGVTGGLVWAMTQIDFEGANAVFTTGLAVITFCAWVLFSTVYILVTGPKIAQYLHLTDHDDGINARLYFGRELSFRARDIAEFDEVATSRYIPFPTLLNPKGANYRIRLRSGRSILIPAHLPGARAIAEDLRGRIEAAARDDERSLGSRR